MRTRNSYALALGLAVGLAGGVTAQSLAESVPTPTAAPVQMRLDGGSFAKLAEAVKPAVVNVNVNAERRAGRTWSAARARST
jgi:S1-C subfamily serine protease